MCACVGALASSVNVAVFAHGYLCAARTLERNAEDARNGFKVATPEKAKERCASLLTSDPGGSYMYLEPGERDSDIGVHAGMALIMVRCEDYLVPVFLARTVEIIAGLDVRLGRGVLTAIVVSLTD